MSSIGTIRKIFLQICQALDVDDGKEYKYVSTYYFYEHSVLPLTAFFHRVWFSPVAFLN